jgi:tRNA pseudouridine38-40 synthase
MRYFIQCIYNGLHFAGFQSQPNAITIQSQVEDAINIVLRQKINLTCSSRTDAQVHAHQNYFHFDTELPIHPSKLIYQLNAVLPSSIAVNKIIPVHPKAHARFSATSRTYHYNIHQQKEPFLHQLSYYYPYKLNIELLHQSAAIIKQQTNFIAFSKAHSQVYTYNCNIISSKWIQPAEHQLQYQVQANRFLRGMVKALVATSLQVATSKLSIKQFQQLFQAKQPAQANFTAPGHALYLHQVSYPDHIF